MVHLEFLAIRIRARRLFIEWFKCQDKQESQEIYKQYLALIRWGSLIAPEPDEMWELVKNED